MLARGTFEDGDKPALQKVETLFRATPYVEGNGHFAGRIALGPDGHLFFTNGERQKFAIKGASFGTASGNASYTRPRPGIDGGRTFLLAAGGRF